MPKKIRFEVVAQSYESGELPDDKQGLLEAARKTCENAYAPYSNFWVGAALLLSNGEVVTGTNQENAAYPSGLCAERTAAYWASSNFPREKILAIAVTARKSTEEIFRPITPCGSCRQSLLEYELHQESPIEVILEAGDGTSTVFPSMETLLPMKFSEKSLG